MKDVEDPNPLIRALAIRTMGYIQVEKIVDVLVDPLRHSLKDRDPYVRKTAATCVAKLYMYDRVLVESEHFVDMLKDLLNDSNPTVSVMIYKEKKEGNAHIEFLLQVVANAVAALTEISERSDNIQLRLDHSIASKLVSALGECSE
jgi:HEAT repeat protein